MTGWTIGQMTWFGQSWEASLNDECRQEPTPVGQACLRCKEPIEKWASGVVMDVVSLNACERQPQHLECFFRATYGSVGHWRRRCSCFGGDEEDPPGLTLREAARAAVLAAHEGWE